MGSSKIERIAGSLDVDQDLTCQRWQWRVQRVGWVMMLLAVLAALAGVLGPGPLSQVVAADPTGAVGVQYNRFERNSRHSELRVRLSGTTVQEGRVRLWMADDYAAGLRLLSITPEPLQVEAQEGRLVYSFAVTAGTSFIAITIHYEHQDAGAAKGRIGVVSGPDVAVSQFVYP